MTHAIDELLDIMTRLRDPQGGCPWDQKQTFETVAPYTLEEAYEVVDAIEQQDYQELKMELGDLLFQVVFYAQMAREQGLFDFADVVNAICGKMIKRHPHVFADAEYASEAELKEAWEMHKKAERETRQLTPVVPSQLDGVTRSLPALVRADKLQKRAARVGFDWPDATGAFHKCREELAEVEDAIANGKREHIEEELGDFLFAGVNLARLLGADAEQVLRRANEKFVGRFVAMERFLAARGQHDLGKLDLAELDAAWEEVKSGEGREDQSIDAG